MYLSLPRSFALGERPGHGGSRRLMLATCELVAAIGSLHRYLVDRIVRVSMQECLLVAGTNLP